MIPSIPVGHFPAPVVSGPGGAVPVELFVSVGGAWLVLLLVFAASGLLLWLLTRPLTPPRPRRVRTVRPPKRQVRPAAPRYA